MCVVASYVLGHDAMHKMGRSNVLISGMKGLGVEIGKYLKTSAQQRSGLKGPVNVSINPVVW